jgi:endonuclease YncB( thermonuclease family)
MTRAMCDTIARCLVSICAAAALSGGSAAQHQSTAQRAASCKFEDAGSGAVQEVLDGRTVVLSDGREVRLAGIETPASPVGKMALEAALGNREVVLRRLGAQTDRYGRTLAHVFTAGEERWMQQALIAGGRARVAASVGDAGCAAALLNAERAARTAKLGLWSEPTFAPRQAGDLAGLLAERARFTLVEGRVVSVRESGGMVYINFSRRWSEDFTATALRRNERPFAAAGLDLKTLAGRQVRVRGFIEERGGPWIEISNPEQIEVIDH